LQINGILENFVTYGIVIAKERIYALPADGGLGMIDVGNFLHAQKCAWIRRCFYRISDAWRWAILQRTHFSLESIRIEFFNKAGNPILWNIAESAIKFQDLYWNTNENYLDALIFNNNMFLQSKPRIWMPPPPRLEWTILRRQLRNDYGSQLLSMKMSEMFLDGGMISYERLCVNMGIQFTVNEYMILVTAASFAREKYGNKETSNGKCIGIKRVPTKGRAGPKYSDAF